MCAAGARRRAVQSIGCWPATRRPIFLGKPVYHKSCFTEPPPFSFVHTHLTVLSRTLGATSLKLSWLGHPGPRRIAQRGSTLNAATPIAVAALVVCLAAPVSLADGSSILQSGIASVYTASSGPKTANGERVRSNALTAAHRTLPFGTKVRVTNVGNGRSVIVRVNDRGPFIGGRIIDLTPAGAHALGFSGIARVTIETL